MNRLLHAVPLIVMPVVAALALAGCAADADAAADPTEVAATPTSSSAALRLWPGVGAHHRRRRALAREYRLRCGNRVPQAASSATPTGATVKRAAGAALGRRAIRHEERRRHVHRARGGPLNRWTLVDVPADVTSLPAGAENPNIGIATANGLRGDRMIGPCAKAGESWEALVHGLRAGHHAGRRTEGAAGRRPRGRRRPRPRGRRAGRHLHLPAVVRLLTVTPASPRRSGAWRAHLARTAGPPQSRPPRRATAPRA